MLFYFCNLQAQNYLWPTNASKNVTSSFGEFRPRHFHAALDIKTWSQTGYKIFAIEDGYIYRIRVSSQGYGKVIYLKLRDGNFAIYAHLNAFVPKLENYTDSLRLAARNNTLDKFPRPSEFPVKKGDLLGYTGDTGIGVPHLHFEMRDPKNFPINPWRFFKSEIVDGQAPFCNSLAIVPLGLPTLINFRPDTLILSLQPSHKITISEPIFLTGKAYIAIKSFDQADGASNLFSFYQAKLFINSSLKYQVKYDRFSYAESRLIELDKNFSLWRRGLGVFHNLYRHPFNSLSFYENSPRGSGELSQKSLNEGLNSIRIELYDFDGNHSQIELQVVYHRNDQIKVFDLSTVSNAALIGLKATVPVERMGVKYWNADHTKMKTATGYQLKLLNNFMSSYFYSLSLPIHPQTEYDIVQISPFDKNGIPLIPIYVNLNGPPQDMPIDDLELLKMRFSGNRVAVETKGPLQRSNQHNITPAFEFQPDPQTSYAVFNVDDFKAHSEKPLSDVHNWVQIIPGRKTSAFSPDNNVRVDFFEDAAYDTFFCKIAIEESPHNLATDYPILTPAYKVNPFDQVLNRGAALSFTIPDSIRGQKGLGVYYWDAKKGWLFLPTDSFREPGALQARITSLEKFAIIRDTIPPEIIPYSQGQFGNLYINNNPLKIGIRDKMSGIYDQDQIEVFVDNNWTLFRYDPEEDQVILAPRHVPAGRHKLKINVTDNVGNQSKREFEILKR